MKWTRGPWGWRKLGDTYHLVGLYGSLPVILSTLKVGRATHLTSRNAEEDRLYPLDPKHPDAQLIAAAPDMADALEEALRLYDLGRETGKLLDARNADFFHMADEAEAIINKARAALAKARGEA